MQVSSFWQQFTTKTESGDLEDLRRDMILEIGAALSIVGWVLFVASIRYDGRLEGLPTALILLIGGIGSIWLRSHRLHIARRWLAITPVLAIASYEWFFPESVAQFCFPIAIVISSLLVSNLGVFTITSLASITCLAIAYWHGINLLDNHQVIAPVVLTYLTGLASWLESRQIQMVLGWLQNSYARARDLLEQLRDERASLARTLKSLEEAYIRIEKMNYALIEARSAAEEAKRLKAEFAANVSHELRTPLNIIIGFSETMANAPETYTGVTWTPALRGDIEHIYRSSRHLLSLIDDILDLSALDAHRLGLVLEETTIASVIEDAIAVVEDLFRAKKLYLRTDIDPDLPRVRIDAVRIRQVLINLLTNASRFTPTGGVTITARLIGQEIQVDVADTGIGIAPQDVSKVFEDFGQVDGTVRRKHGGTGLGVPLSKRLVELHGGRMWLDSQVGQGTIFHFTLPIHGDIRSIRRRPSAGSIMPLPTYRKCLLVYEPDPLLLRALRRQLSSYDVIEIKEPLNAPALIDRYQPTALIADCQIGEETAVQQRWLEVVPPDLPVITVSLPGTLRSAQLLGIADFLIKPISREQLLEAISDLGRPVHSILIVDDDPQLVDLFSRILQSVRNGYLPIRAFGGQEALELLRTQHVDLVLLDLLMPDVDGLAVLKEMKADPMLAQIPVVMISGQYPDTIQSTGGLAMGLRRMKGVSIGETFNYLAALVDAMPVRGLPSSTIGRGSSAVQRDQQAS